VERGVLSYVNEHLKFLYFSYCNQIVCVCGGGGDIFNRKHSHVNDVIHNETILYNLK